MDHMTMHSEASPVVRRPWYRGPLAQLALNGFLIAVSEIMLKKGATATSHIPAPAWLARLGVTALVSWWVWGGIATHILGFLTWLNILRFVPLSIAYPIASVVHVLIPLGAWWFLGERVSPVRWAGILLIVAGIWLIAQTFTKAEESL